MTYKPWLAAAVLTLSAALAGAQGQPGVTDTEIRIGQFAAQTGPAAELGKRLQAGINAHFSAVNAAGGINGRQIRLVSRDDGYEPEKAAAAVKALIEEDKVFALIGSVGTPTTLAAIPAINAAGIPLIGPFTGAQALREPFNRNLFHVRASYFDETEKIVQHLSTLGMSRFFVFYQNDAFGTTGLDGVTRALTKRKLTAVGAATVERNSVDVAAALAEVVKLKPDAVIQISAYKSSANLIKLARAKAYTGQFVNVSFVGSQALAAELGDAGRGVAISQVMPFPFTPKSAIVREYQQRMNEAKYTDYDYSSIEGFIAAKVLTEGLRRAGRGLSRESFTTALESLRDLNMGGFMIGFGPNDHEGSSYTDMSILSQGGRFVH